MKNLKIRNIICIVLVACYFIGLLCMFLNQLLAGLSLWAISTVGGFIALYHIRNHEEKEAAEKAAKDGDDNHANEA